MMKRLVVLLFLAGAWLPAAGSPDGRAAAEAPAVSVEIRHCGS